MINHDPLHGDNTICDLCKDVFDARNSNYDIFNNNWICSSCVDKYSDEELEEIFSV